MDGFQVWTRFQRRIWRPHGNGSLFTLFPLCIISHPTGGGINKSDSGYEREGNTSVGEQNAITTQPWLPVMRLTERSSQVGWGLLDRPNVPLHGTWDTETTKLKWSMKTFPLKLNLLVILCSAMRGKVIQMMSVCLQVDHSLVPALHYMLHISRISRFE